MRKYLFILITLSFIFSAAADTPSGDITITAQGFENSDGKARILLFSSKNEDSFPSKPDKAYRKKNVLIKNNKITITFKDVPYGNYAVSVHHDENDDDKVNTNWIGIPNEGLGSSNDAKGNFGPPSFDDAKFELNKMKLEIIINMVN